MRSAQRRHAGAEVIECLLVEHLERRAEERGGQERDKDEESRALGGISAVDVLQDLGEIFPHAVTIRSSSPLARIA